MNMEQILLLLAEQAPGLVAVIAVIWIGGAYQLKIINDHNEKREKRMEEVIEANTEAHLSGIETMGEVKGMLAKMNGHNH